MVFRQVVIWLLAVFIIATAFLPSQSDFQLILVLFSLSMACYALMIKNLEHYSENTLRFSLFITVGVLCFSFPNLSDDIYRFYWDAILVDQGLSPYAELPSSIYAENGENAEIFQLLNSKEYYSVYPPVNQLLYWLAYKVSFDIQSFSIFLKAIYGGLVILGLHWTRKLIPFIHGQNNLVYIYFLNPLVLVEGLGNLHIEIVMVSFLAGAFYYYGRSKKYLLSAFTYSIGLAIKLVPLIIAPFFWFKQKSRWRILFAGIVILLMIVFLSPILIWSGGGGFTDSLDLYFRKFEFNASIYYLLRYIGFQWKGYNLIAYLGPLLGLLTFGLIMWLSWRVKDRSPISVIKLSLIAWSIYLLMSTTIHPWYIIPLIYFGTLSRIWFPILWSYLITWTYINYSYSDYFENLWVVSAEYILVGSIIYIEYQRYIKRKAQVLQPGL